MGFPADASDVKLGSFYAVLEWVRGLEIGFELGLFGFELALFFGAGKRRFSL